MELAKPRNYTKITKEGVEIIIMSEIHKIQTNQLYIIDVYMYQKELGQNILCWTSSN